MSSMTEAAPLEKTAQKTLPWALWRRQVAAVLRLELKKNFFSRRAILIYLLALMPVALLSVLAIIPPDVRAFQDAGILSQIFSGLYEGLILRTIVFFGCAWIFMNLFRGEVVDKSLHYYFLAPIKREVLVAGKYISGLLTSVILFFLTTALSYLLLFMPRAAGQQFFFSGVGLRHLLTYVSITILACIGYGAVFLVIGLFFRNPIIPAVIIYGWEFINFLLPALLKKVSVIHYLKSLTPVPMSEGPFAIVAEPTPAWLSVPGLLIFTAILLVIASVRIRKTEIRYGGE